MILSLMDEMAGDASRAALAKYAGHAGRQEPDENLRKVATVLVAMGPNRAAKLLAGYPPDIVERLAQEIAAIRSLSQAEVHAALTEFAEELVARKLAAEGGTAYCLAMLTELVGPERAKELVARIDPVHSRPFGYLAAAEPEFSAMVLAAEPSSSVAVALAHLEPAVAARILAKLPVERQAEVAVRMATLEFVHVDVVRQLDEDLRVRVAPLLSQPFAEFEGVTLLVDLLHSSSQETEKAVLDSIRQLDGDLAVRVKEALFTFDDVVRLDDRAVQEVLKSVDIRDVAIALKDAADEVAERIFRNLSERARENLKDEIEFLRGLRKKDIQSAQKRIVDVIRVLEEEGKIQITREDVGGDE